MIGPLITVRDDVPHMFRPKVTVNYPHQKVPMFPSYRGKQVLMRDENGLEKCGLRSLLGGVRRMRSSRGGGERRLGDGGSSYVGLPDHKTRCIFCGYCEEACPVSAIFMGKDYEPAVYSKDDFIWDKADLWCRRRHGETAAGRRRPVTTAVCRRPTDRADWRPRHPRKFRRDAPRHERHPTCRSGCAWVMWRAVPASILTGRPY
jgi:NADH-quinone oxidoreductase subunit I